jgi:hypothetical protein
MTKKADDESFVAIGARKVPIEMRQIPIDDLRFYEDNPRIFSLVAGKGIKGDQSKIEAELWDLDTTKELYQAVRSNGGLIEEVVV